MPVGWVLWACERVGMGKGKRGPSGTELASCSSSSLDHTLCLCGNQGGWKWEPEGTVSLSANVRDPRGMRPSPACPKVRPFWVICSLTGLRVIADLIPSHLMVACHFRYQYFV